MDFYWQAWELAWDHVVDKPGAAQSPYMDEAFDPNVIWIWDTCFMVHFCKYAPQVFPGIQSFDNFYAPLHHGRRSSLAIQHPDNPPLFAWIEEAYLRFTAKPSNPTAGKPPAFVRISTGSTAVQVIESCGRTEMTSLQPYGFPDPILAIITFLMGSYQ